MKKLAIGILAHVDAGKTTLSEAMLYSAGEIRKLGRVDHKNAFLDTHDLERERGITIFSKQALMHLPNTVFTLLDTPGHVDFSAETERTLSVLDYAVLVVSAAEGVQSHTETLWQLLKRYGVPTFIFVNKMDISQYSKEIVREEIRQKLSCVDFSEIGTESFFDALAMCDETLMETFLETGTVPDGLIQEAIQKRHAFPCFFGSALKMDGISALLSALDRFTMQKQAKSEFGAKVFKITEDSQGNRLTHLKITGGTLTARMSITDTEKINQIRLYSGDKFTTANELTAGEICAVTGLDSTFAASRWVLIFRQTFRYWSRL